MTTIKQRVMRVSEFDRIKYLATRGAATPERDAWIAAGASELENQRLQPYMELLGDALQVIEDATNAPPESPDWSAFETLLARADGMLPKGDV